MSCNAEEIAEKRRIAQERLKEKARKSTEKILPPVAVVSPPNNFYGNVGVYNNTNSYVRFMDSVHQNTIKPKNLAKNRILTQPYQKKNESLEVSSFNKLFNKTITCTCSLITDDRFVVESSGYSEKLINELKLIPSKVYDASTKNWNFLIKDYDLVLEKVNRLNPEIVIGTLPNFILDVFRKPKITLSLSCLMAIEPVLSSVLLPFQNEGVCFGIDKRGRCLIADEMGLGKTYQALGIADFYKENWPLFIGTTATTRDVWTKKIKELLPNVPLHSIVTVNSNRDYFAKANIVIASYSIMERHHEKLLKKKFGVVIFDESHLLKNFKAKCTLIASKLAKQARRVILLTGTPALSRPSELFSQLEMLDPNFFNFKEYSIRYCEGKQSNFGWVATGQSNLTELNLLLSRKFMIRRTKAEVMTELSEKKRETIILDETLIEDSEENLLVYATDFSQSEGKKRDEILMKFYSETAIAKRKAVCAYLKTLIKDNIKFIVFAHHICLLDAISDCLVQLDVDFIRIDGSTKHDVRNFSVNRFQTKDKCRAAVLSLKACNSGITLTAAKLVVFAELDWNPSTLAQAESRAHRLGQDGIVTCRYLMAKGTADDVIWEMLKKKQNVLNKAGLCNENFSETELVANPSTSKNFQKYLKPSNSDCSTMGLSQIDFDEDVFKDVNENIKEDPQNEFQKMLEGDDDDFFNLKF